LPITGLAAWKYYLLYGKIRGCFRVKKLIYSKNKLFEKLDADYKKLLNMIFEI
jgi:hypothetical protein